MILEECKRTKLSSLNRMDKQKFRSLEPNINQKDIKKEEDHSEHDHGIESGYILIRVECFVAYFTGPLL
jgi:hypothetical protein